MRLYYSLPLSCGITVIVMYITGGSIADISTRLTIAIASLCCVISAGFVLNNVCDIAVDRINCPDRCLESIDISTKAALILSAVLFALGISLASFCGWEFLCLMAVIILGLTVYDIFSKKMGFFKAPLVALLATMLYPLAFTIAEPVQTLRLNVLYFHPVWFFLTALAYEMLKDIRDRKGDSTVATSFADYRCKSWFLPLARIIAVTAGIITLIPSVLDYCGYIYLTAAIIAVLITIAACLAKPVLAIKLLYAEVVVITAGSLMDLLVFAP